MTEVQELPTFLSCPLADKNFKPVPGFEIRCRYEACVWGGGESGPGARHMDIEWARSLKDQCVDAGVPFFYKQGPGDDGRVVKMPVLDGRTWDQRPE